MLMALDYGEGRVFHTTLGHDVKAMSGAGFQETLKRGTEWAATGKVTFPAVGADILPEDRVVYRDPQPGE
jgi:type 1 glutamine amidotransferase